MNCKKKKLHDLVLFKEVTTNILRSLYKIRGLKQYQIELKL